MSKFSFEQYRKVFNDAVEKHKDQPFYAALIDKFGVPKWPQNAGECVLLGIRHDGKDVDHREDIADDTIVLCRLKGDSQPEVVEAAGTTESGLFTEKINPKGDFKMYPGFYFFNRGLHKGTKPCLVQAGLVRGERAQKHSGYDAKEWSDTGTTIHIHAGIMNPQKVGNWSAGCQVVAKGWTGTPWVTIFGACKQSPQSIFPYVLVDEPDAVRSIETSVTQ